MDIEKKVSRCLENAKLRNQLYDAINENIWGLHRDYVRKIISELNDYLKQMEVRSRMEPWLFLRYVTCCQAVFHYLYKMRQIDRDGGIDPEISKNIEDVLIDLLEDHDAS